MEYRVERIGVLALLSIPGLGSGFDYPDVFGAVDVGLWPIWPHSGQYGAALNDVARAADKQKNEFFFGPPAGSNAVPHAQSRTRRFIRFRECVHLHGPLPFPSTDVPEFRRQMQSGELLVYLSLYCL